MAVKSSDRDTTLDGVRDIRVYQHRCGYRFSVDALLLYSFVKVRHACAIVDLGAGSGIIGLLLARKFEKAKVLLVELQEGLYRLARKNIELNGLAERVTAVLSDVGLAASEGEGTFLCDIPSRKAYGTYGCSQGKPPGTQEGQICAQRSLHLIQDRPH
ncbi:MAG: methyltransferase [Anaerolineales bacterium]